MNLNLLPDLALFVQIVDQGSFSAVARQSGLTPLRREPQRVAAGAGDGQQAAASYHPQAATGAMPGKQCISMPSRCWKRRGRR